MGLAPSRDDDVTSDSAGMYSGYGGSPCAGPLPTSPPPRPPSALHQVPDQPVNAKRRREFDHGSHRHRQPHARYHGDPSEPDMRSMRQESTDADTDPEADPGPASADDVGPSVRGGVPIQTCRAAVSLGSRSYAAMRPESEQPDVVPVVFTWNFGGARVFVVGAWDGWGERTQMSRDGSTFIAVLYLPCGQTFQFKYFVDDNWQCNPSLPTQTDSQGNTNNVVDVTHPELEFDSATVLTSCSPPSPLSSYCQSVIEADETFADPIALPDAMAASPVVLPPRSHVLMDHLHLCQPELEQTQTDPAGYACSPATSPAPLTLATCFRYKEKLISATFVFSTSQSFSASSNHFNLARELPMHTLTPFSL